jgi:hypothetical protein
MDPGPLSALTECKLLFMDIITLRQELRARDAALVAFRSALVLSASPQLAQLLHKTASAVTLAAAALAKVSDSSTNQSDPPPARSSKDAMSATETSWASGQFDQLWEGIVGPSNQTPEPAYTGEDAEDIMTAGCCMNDNVHEEAAGRQLPLVLSTTPQHTSSGTLPARGRVENSPVDTSASTSGTILPETKRVEVSPAMSPQPTLLEYWRGYLQTNGGIYSKINKVHARKATFPGAVVVTINGTVQEKPYTAGDYVVCSSSEGNRDVMCAHDFMMQFQHTQPAPASVADLADDGFKLFKSSVTPSVWAHALSETDISTYFMSGRFTRSASEEVEMKAGDMIMLQFPVGETLDICGSETFSDLYQGCPDSNVPTQEAAMARWARKIESEGSLYLKTTSVLAKMALEDGQLDLKSKSYKKGDFIILSVDPTDRYPMSPSDFALRYATTKPKPIGDLALAEEGFKKYSPTGRIWARALSSEEILQCFPSGYFVASWGSPVPVKPGDYLALPFPKCDAVYGISDDLLNKTYSLDDGGGDSPLIAQQGSFSESRSHIISGSGRQRTFSGPPALQLPPRHSGRSYHLAMFWQADNRGRFPRGRIPQSVSLAQTSR